MWCLEERKEESKGWSPLDRRSLQGMFPRGCSVDPLAMEDEQKMKPPKGFPAELIIAGTTWTVEYVPGLLQERQLYGETRPHERRILIAGDQHPDQAKSTLMHECLHACMSINSSHGLDHETEERLVRSLENALLSLVRDNPKVKWKA